jgi:glucuronate isomerase
MPAKLFLDDNFLLHSPSAEKLYHDYAKDMPIFDYHCHLPPDEIAQNRQFKNFTEIWLGGDHYKWRAMRTNGVPEQYITGKESDEAKFVKWAETVPYTLRNPLYHWTHLELKNYFGITEQLSGKNAKKIYDAVNAQLAQPEFRVQGLLHKMKVKFIGTTDDPLDSLEHHIAIRKLAIGIDVRPSFRPDKAVLIENQDAWNQWIDNLVKLTGESSKTYDQFLSAIKKRHDFFHEVGCRISDRGLDSAYAEDFTASEIEAIYQKGRAKQTLTPQEILQFKSAIMLELARMDHSRGWVMQLHLGAMRNNNSRMKRTLGPDTGFDSIGDLNFALALSKFLDRLDTDNRLPKTILYNLNPRDNDMMATMIGNFQDGSTPGKIQFGSGWWFLDQKDGMEKQMNALSNMGLLSRFVGMLTDSRSFVSYPRHEYFRRILCQLLGSEVDRGELPNDLPLIGEMVKDICYRNAEKYFAL